MKQVATNNKDFRVKNGLVVEQDATIHGNVTFNGTITGNLIPDTDITYDLGSVTNRFRDLYLSGNTINIGDATISASGDAVILPSTTKIGDASLPPVDLEILPETLEIQVSATAPGDDIVWNWTWLQSTLPYARVNITNSPQLSVPLYKKGTYTLNNFAAYETFGDMTQVHFGYLKWVDGAGTDNLVSWATYVQATYSHPDINGGNPTLVQRYTILVPENLTLPTLTLPQNIGYDVSFTTAGAYTFGANMIDSSDTMSVAYGNNPNIGPMYRGATYTFYLDTSLEHHPFYITTDNGQGFVSGQYVGEYTSGVTGSRNNGTTGKETLTFTVPMNAPDTLYYQCGIHQSMRGVMTIKDLAVEVNSNGNYILYFQHTHEGHKTPIEIRPIPALVNQMCLVYSAAVGKFVPQDLSTYIENTPSFKSKIQEVAGTATLVDPTGQPIVATVKIFADPSYLPFAGNRAGDIAYTEDTNTMFIWDVTAYNWISTKAKSTSEVAEGTNLYYTHARARSSVSVTDSGGDGSLSYNSSTGIFTYTGPSATEVRSHFSAGTGVTITDGVIATTIAQYTDALARGAISFTAGSGAYDSITGVVTIPTNTNQLTNGANFATTSYVDSAVQGKDNTDEITEGTTNLYFTTARARDAVSAGTGISYNSTTGVIVTTITQYTDALARGAVSAGTGISYDSTTGVITNTITQYTDALARAALSVTDSGGDGSLSYNNSTGVITYTGPSATEVRSHFSAGTGITITDGVIAHNDTSSVANLSSDNANGTVIQDISYTFDTFGHVTAASVSTVDLDSRYYTETEADTRFINTAGDTMTGFLSLHADPTQAMHAVTKEYVDSVAAGLKAAPAVEVATTANLSATYSNGTLGVGATLTATANGAFPAIDGITVATTTPGQNGILIKNQSNAAHNGRYNLTQIGDAGTPWILTRCGVCDQASEIPGSYVFVKAGTTQAGTGWVAYVASPSTFTVGTDNIIYFQFSGAGTYTAGSGLSLTGTQFSVDATSKSNWDTAYADRNKWDGGSTGLTASTGRTSLGATTLGANIFTITNPGAVTFPRFNADNTVSSLSATDFRTAIGAGTSSATGTVTSVGGTGTVSGLTLSGTVTTSGNLTLGGTLAVTASNFASQTANSVLIAPTGSAGVPTFRALVAADIPTLNQNTTGTAANVTGTVAIANGGTGATTAANALTNLGAYAASNPSAFINQAGARTALSFTAGSGAYNNSTGVITIPTNTNQLTNGAGFTTNTGTVTSVGGTGTVSGLTLSGTVTTSGNLTLGGTLSLTSGNVTGALGFTPYNATNPSGYITSSGSITGSAGSLSNTVDYFVNRGSVAAANIDTALGHGVWNQTNVGDSHTLLVFGAGGSTSTVQQRFLYTGSMEFRNRTDSSTWTAWKTVLHNNNFNSYAPTLTGGSASGTWGINITGSSASTTGNAATATTLQTARTINGVSFNGSANITVTAAANGGNAATATTLQTARTINGVSFNGSANITVTAAANGGNAATAGGFTPSASSGVGSRIVVADGNGYIFNNYFNSTDNSVASGVTAVMVKQGDNYYRSGTAAAIATFISGQTMNNLTIGSQLSIGTSASIRQSSSTWTGDAAAGQGKLEYHAQRWYVNAGSDSALVCQFRRGGSDVANVDNSGVYNGTASSARFADLAENYLADASYDEGTVLIIGGTHEVTISNESHCSSVIGVVSTKPAYLMNSELKGDHVVTVALQGRVPVKVTGKIKKGDIIVASDVEGHGCSLNRSLYMPGCIIGKSLEDFDGDTGIIEVVVGCK